MANNRWEVAVYHLLDTQLLINNQDILKAALCFNQNENDFQLIINPVSGWMELKHNDALHAPGTKSYLPQSSEEALKAAEQYFSNVNGIMELKGGKFQQLGIPPLFGMKLKHVYTNYVPSAQSKDVDHWLCRFFIFLDTAYTNGTNYVQVMGAGLDIRIGSGGKMIGLSYHWRPIIQKQRKPVITAFVDQAMVSLPELYKVQVNHHPGGSTDHHHDDETIPPAETPEENQPPSLKDQVDQLLESNFNLLYKFDDEYSPAKSLAPFLVFAEGHHLAYAPLCEYSLVAQIGYDGHNTPLILEAIVLGGSGQFDYEWAYWQFHRMEAGIQTGGSSATLTIPADVYNVALHVTDRKTGQSVQTQTMTYGNWSIQNPQLT